MKAAVLGATGGIGRHVAQHALEEGHEVRAYVRDPSKLDIASPPLTVLRTAERLRPRAWR